MSMVLGAIVFVLRIVVIYSSRHRLVLPYHRKREFRGFTWVDFRKRNGQHELIKSEKASPSKLKNRGRWRFILRTKPKIIFSSVGQWLDREISVVQVLGTERKSLHQYTHMSCCFVSSFNLVLSDGFLGAHNVTRMTSCLFSEVPQDGFCYKYNLHLFSLIMLQEGVAEGMVLMDPLRFSQKSANTTATK